MTVFKIIFFFSILYQFAHAQFFRGEEVVGESYYNQANIVLEHDSVSINYLGNYSKKDFSIAYSDIKSVKIIRKLEKELLKYSIFGTIIFFAAITGGSPLPELANEPTQVERALWWKSSIELVCQNETIYLRALQNHKLLKSLRKKIKNPST